MPPRPAAPLPRWTDDPATVRPMFASALTGSAAAVTASSRHVFERKLDGMRVLAALEPAHPIPSVRLWSRNGHDKTAQFPDLVRELQRFATATGVPLLLDGEVVALDARGEPTTFVELAGRLHERDRGEITRKAAAVPVAMIVFDLLREGQADLRGLPLTDRKARLEKVFHTRGSERLRESEFSTGNGARWLARAARERWEGIIAKDATSRYESGRRSPCWLKVKVVRQQEFLVGGWTRPRNTRAHFGSLVVGYYEPVGADLVLRHAGSVGSGFTGDHLERLWNALKSRAIPTCPFGRIPPTMEPARWVRPDIVVEVRFSEWTPDGVLRHPVFMGVRDDVDPTGVRREADATSHGLVLSKRRGERVASDDAPTCDAPVVAKAEAKRQKAPAINKRRSKKDPASSVWMDLSSDAATLVEHLEALEAARRDAALALPGGTKLDVSNLHKVFWPALGLTKGDLMRHYVRVSPALLPIVEDRPLIMKRYPNGVTGKSFYQQRAPDDPPPGVRAEHVKGDEDVPTRLIGGTLGTLIYMVQLASISQDPWFSRVQSPGIADYVALDLDPMPGVPFAQVRDVARLVRDELASLDVPACLKTSGSSGLHVYIPLEPGATYEAGQLFCRIVATLVARRHPAIATVERSVAARGRTVYVDFLQNIEGKSLASAYSVRANEFAGVSTPLAWSELEDDVHPEDVTLRNAAARFRETGDLWAPMARGPRADLRDALVRLERRG
jgi:bifunctional non-homologous end joining protein LigD